MLDLGLVNKNRLRRNFIMFFFVVLATLRFYRHLSPDYLSPTRYWMDYLSFVKDGLFCLILHFTACNIPHLKLAFGE